MARPKSDNFDQNEYINGYIKEHYKWVNVPFSMNNPEDVELYEYLKKFSRGKKTPYIKKLIREDMINNEVKYYGEVIDYKRNEFTDKNYDFIEHTVQSLICQRLIKLGLLKVERDENDDIVRYKWLLRGTKQKDNK